MARVVRIAAIVLLALGLFAAPLAAGALDDAKAAGQVGERIDGYLGVVDAGAPGAVRALVEEINQERRAKYAEIAKKRGTPVEAVAQVAGQKLIERTPGGQYVMGADGKWRQK